MALVHRPVDCDARDGLLLTSRGDLVFVCPNCEQTKFRDTPYFVKQKGWLRMPLGLRRDAREAVSRVNAAITYQHTITPLKIG